MSKKPDIYIAILEIFKNQKMALLVAEVTDLLHKLDLKPNKSSIYRAILKLEQNGLLTETDTVAGAKRYELADLNHQHHHLICKNCNKLICLDLEDKLTKIIQDIELQTNFKVQTGRVDFYGICQECQVLNP